jgi:predicted MPP superfamily phosphohydrolase
MYPLLLAQLALPTDAAGFAALLVFAGVCLGHAAIILFCLNWLYGCDLPRGLLRVVRRASEMVILASPVVLWYASGFDLFAAASRAGHPAAYYLLAGYGIGCAALGLAVLPALTVWRLVRPKPAALLSNDTQTLDVAKELGYKPVGRGKYRQLARLPYNEIFQVDFSVRTYRLPRLPAAWDGLSILHLSDLHLCGTPDRVFYETVLDRCRAWEPDLVAITGDFIDSDAHHRWLIPLLGRLRWNVAAFAVLGNHDYYRDHAVVRRRLRKIGFRVLGNSWEQITVRGLPLVVVGNECPWFRPRPDLSQCPADVFRLCLSHTPDEIQWARQNGIDLMLAGHVHGGQIRFPVIGSVFVPSRYSRRYDCGSFHEPPTLMHVSRGLAGKHPLRYNCRPEVTKVVLRAGQA